MLAILALLALPPTSTPAKPPTHGDRAMVSAADKANDELRAKLTKRFKDLDALEQGLFSEDITADVSSFFPVGQPFHQTERIVAEQNLGPLKKFKGEPDSEGVTMYVPHFNLMAEMFTHVYVVLDFDYEGTGEDDMRLKRMKAFLRASNM